MAQYINKDDLVEEIEKRLDELWDLLPNASDVIKDNYTKEEANITGKYTALESFEKFINTIEVKEVDLEKESELIANGIMISVQSNKYGTNTYNTERNDFNHYHLKMAARKGIELGLKAQKGE